MLYSRNIRVDGYDCWNSKRQLPFIVCRPRKTNFRFPCIFIDMVAFVDIYINIYLYIHIFRYLYLYISAAISNGKRKAGRFSSTRLPFAHRANGVCHLSVCLRRNKQKDPFANGLNRPAHLYSLEWEFYGANSCRYTVTFCRKKGGNIPINWNVEAVKFIRGHKKELSSSWSEGFKMSYFWKKGM